MSKNRNKIQHLTGAFGNQDKGGFVYESDARDTLKPYLGSQVKVSGFIEKLSVTKSLKPKPSAFLIDVEVDVNKGKSIEFEYLWLETDLFKAGVDYVFEATVISYLSRKGQEVHVKYALGEIHNVVEVVESRNKTLDEVIKKKEVEEKVKHDNDPSIAIEVISEIMRDYGYVATPGIIASGEWQCTISDLNTGESMIISTEATFPAAVLKARDIISFIGTKK